MKTKFDPKEALTLYLVLICFVVAFFVTGLYVGRHYLAQPSQAADEPLDEELPVSKPPEDLSGELDFYEHLSTPVAGEGAQEGQAAGEPSDERLTIQEPPGSTASTGPAADQPAGEVAQERLFEEEAGFTIQVAAFTTQEEARQMVVRLEVEDFSAEVKPPPADGSSRFYRVWVGRFPSRAAAHDAEESLKEKGFPTYVRRLAE